MPQVVAVSWAEPSAENQWLTPHVGDFSRAERCYFSVPMDRSWGDSALQTRWPPKAWHNPEKTNLFMTRNQGPVSANSERQRPVTNTQPLQKVRWTDTYSTSADTSYSRVSYCFTYMSCIQCTFCGEWQLDKKCNTVNKQQIQFFVCLILKLQITTQRKKRQNELIRLSLAISTLKLGITSTNDCAIRIFRLTVFERNINIIYTDTQTQQTYVHILYKAAFTILLLEGSGFKLNSSLCLRQHTPMVWGYF